MTEVLQKLGADPVPRKKRKLKGRKSLNLGKEVAAALLAAPPVDQTQAPVASVPAQVPSQAPALAPAHPPPRSSLPAPTSPPPVAQNGRRARSVAPPQPQAQPLAGPPVSGPTPADPRPAAERMADVVQLQTGPPPIEVEYIFGGAIPDAIVPVTTIAVLPPRPEEPEQDITEDKRAVSTSLFDRAKRSLRKG